MGTLNCEIYGRAFDSAATRPFSHCEECAGKLRNQNLGPTQLLYRPEVADVVRAIVRREFDPAKG